VLYDGFDIAVVAMGLFGIAEIMRNLEYPERRPFAGDIIGRLLPDWSDMKESAGAVGRGSLLGTIVGIIPGNGATLSSFASYVMEKRIARHPERFGHGAIQGVAGPESANNAAAQTTFVPLLTLGLPSTATMALIGGAMTLHGVIPGPQVIDQHPDLFWGVVTSMWIGNLMLVIINLPMIGIWVQFLKVPYRILFPMIVLICCIGIYSVKSRPEDVIQVALFGVAGYLLFKLRFEPAPLLLGLVLGGMMEDNLRRGLILSKGHAGQFLGAPLTRVLLAIAVLVLGSALKPTISKRRRLLAED
jgi:putative tricarboxylic transport membrane protein